MTERNGGLNPFRELDPRRWAEVVQQRRIAASAQKRFEQVSEAYKALVSDPRYAAIKDELEASLGESLNALVKTAEVCGRCAPAAVRVKALNEIVARPLHHLFFEAQRSRIEPVESAGEGI